MKQRSIGLHVAISGPDGVGKSTVTERVCELIDSRFASLETSHLYSRTTHQKRSTVGLPPYLKPPRDLVGSFAKVVYMIYGYHRLFWGWVRPHTKRGGIFWSDRYFTDLLADQERFRVRLPVWVLLVFWRFVPKPDLNLILITTAETIQERCDEVNLEQTQEQVRGYERLLGQSDQFIRVDAAQSIEESSTYIAQLIIDRQNLSSKRTHSG